ncbi:hypothetical protein DZA65_03427 [Dickeya dianthicola]|uniref:DUF1330 domain-containing protein n=1 Tax=Dickeya dianthicola TaxID=204039 RepID=A0ABX9NT65_9GAMM|nr:DUF1330 domain-containing protein [Dickeya dianthicola]AYC20286.1 hypothetical protein DZA65_03427 [Dickeya dianthicola]MBI0437673.1 DUF1330 domain-containing protein [Dickeya dianthicola]MBI0449959.1 DUF1330 domain-containing protein [Dickeya dianthicola]MBI0454571.1 DUF1330 domain-containing protein [Dickeya dianthicola]MBI0457509.1 DUF1330 domain-containing protein [Dickeya dianthicola]
MKNSKPAYFIFSVNVTDPQGLAPYQEKVGETVKAYGGQLIVQSSSVVSVEGMAPVGRIIILQFEHAERALAWHQSPEYQAIIHYRFAAANTQAWLVEGI